MTSIANDRIGQRKELLRKFFDDIWTGAVAGPYAAFRVAMSVGLLSMWFESLQDHGPALIALQFSLPVAVMVVQLLILPLVLIPSLSRYAILCFIALQLPELSIDWFSHANHGWLALWCLTPAVIFDKWWESEDYQKYLRVTLGVVMLAAAAQKLLAGTYLDGSYISWLSYYGSETEQMFRFLCGAEAQYDSCGPHAFIGGFIVGWQIIVGLLLIMGYRSMIFLAVEIAFLLGAGLYADEMNFQTLNIAILCIAFGVGMKRDLVYLCLALLLIDTHGISQLIADIG